MTVNCRIHVSDDDVAFWEANKISPTIKIDSMRDVFRVFVNGQLAGTSLMFIRFLQICCFYAFFVFNGVVSITKICKVLTLESVCS